MQRTLAKQRRAVCQKVQPGSAFATTQHDIIQQGTVGPSHSYKQLHIPGRLVSIYRLKVINLIFMNAVFLRYDCREVNNIIVSAVIIFQSRKILSETHQSDMPIGLPGSYFSPVVSPVP